jgi:hypothetical protein
MQFRLSSGQKRKSRYAFASVLALSMVIASDSMANETVSIGDVTGTGLSYEEIDVVESLLEGELLVYDQVRIVKTDADMVISARITRLDLKYMLVVTGVEPSGTSRSRQQKIESFDEVDVAIRNLVRAVVEDLPEESPSGVGKAVDEKQSRPPKEKSIAGWNVSGGAGWSMSDAISNNGTLFAGSVGYVWEVSEVLLELRTDFQVGFEKFDVGADSGSLALSYVWFDRGGFGLFSGGQVGMGYFNGDNGSDEVSKFDFVYGAHTGILLLRNSDITLDLRFHVMLLAEEHNGSVPAIGMALIGIHF